MNGRDGLRLDAALADFVAQAQLLEDEFFIEPVVEDLTEMVEPYVEEEAAEMTLRQDTIPACIGQRTLLVSMMASAALSALVVVCLLRPSAPAPIAAAIVPRPKIEVTLPRAQPAPPPAPAPTVIQLPAPPAPVARAHPQKKRALTAKASFARSFAD